MKKILLTISILLALTSAPIFAEDGFYIGPSIKQMPFINAEDFFTLVTFQNSEISTVPKVLSILFMPNDYSFIGVDARYNYRLLQVNSSFSLPLYSIISLTPPYIYVLSLDAGVKTNFGAVGLSLTAGPNLWILDNGNILPAFNINAHVDVNVGSMIISSNLTAINSIDGFISNQVLESSMMEWGISLLFKM